MKRILLGFILMLPSCSTTHVTTYTVSVSNVATTHTQETSGIVCRDNQVLNTVNYTLPPLPSLDNLAADDAQGIIDVLISHISKLRSDLKSLSKDYGCSEKS